MKNWQDEYKSKLISAEEAAGLVKSGDQVVFTAGREAFAIGLAIAARKPELSNVKIHVPSPGYDFGWYDSAWEDSFNVTVGFPTATCQEAVNARRVDINTGVMLPFAEHDYLPQADVLLTEISPPNELGFCSFGQSLWNKRRHIKQAKLVIAEVNKNLIRTYGDNYVHVNEIDYFVEHVSLGGKPKSGSLAGRPLKKPEPWVKRIRELVSSLIKDGDTIQIGVGRTTEPLVQLGLLSNKVDLGYHSEATPPGIISLAREGIINGKYKTVNPGKLVVTSIGGSSAEEMQWVDNNPLVYLVDVEYLEDIRVIAAHDNMVGINQALMVDLSGQIAAESIGPSIMALAGGQIPFASGCWLSKGGRYITVLPSTARNGSVSRIVPMMPEGTVVTLQRNLADYVVTEYGYVRLRGKSLRERAEALVSIAHPDFRSELQKAARKLLWP